MQPCSTAFADAARQGAPVAVRAWVQRQNKVMFGPDGLYLSDATVTFDEFAASRRALSASVLDPDGLLRPRFATDAFAPFGNELVIESGFVIGESAEYVRLGTFRLQVAEDSDGRVRVTGLDRSAVIAAALNEEPYVIASGTILSTAIGDYLEAKYPGIPFLPDPSAEAEAVPSTLVYEEGSASGDPWKNMRDLATAFGRELFIDAYGRVVLRPVPTQTGAPYAAVYRPGELNMGIGATVRLDPAGVKNVVKVIGEGSNLTESVVATAEIDDPSDPLYAGTGSVFGRRPEVVRTSAVGTTAQAQAAADAILLQRRGVAENAAIQLAPVAQHEPGDIVAYTSERDVVVGVYALSQWTLDVFLRSTMTVATRRLRAPAGSVIAVRRAGAEAATATGVAYDAVGQSGDIAPAEAATAAGVANSAAASVQANAANAAGTGTANNAAAIAGQLASAESATAAGVANSAAGSVKPSAGNAAGTGTGNGPSVSVKPSAGNAAGTGTANNATVTTGPTYEDEVTADSPLLWWRNDESAGTTANDSSGNGRNGTYNGGFTLDQSSAITTDASSKSVALNGSTAYISSSYGAFSPGSSRTYEIWYNRANTAAAHALFSDSGANVLLRFPSGSSNILFFPDTSTASTNWTGASPGTAQWVHLVLLLNDAAHTAELYINGVSKGQNTGIASLVPSANLVVGAFGTTSEFWNGSVEEMAVYSGLLSSSRIVAHYNAAT